MVVYLHSYYLEGEKYPECNYIMNFVGGGICGLANYMFFLISGYLYYLNVKSHHDTFVKIKKRCRTLLVPYILWNLIFILWYFCLSLIPSLQERFVNGSIISQLEDSSVLEMFYIVFLKPAAFQLWFLRDLMLFVLLSPLIWWLIKKTGWALVVVLFGIGMFIPQIGFAAMFVLGGYMSLTNTDLDGLTDQLSRLMPLFVTVFLASAVVYPMHLDYVKPFAPLTYLCGIVVFWYMYDKLHIAKIKWFEPYLGYSFFIYCFHMPFFNIIKKLMLIMVGESKATILGLYFINPIIAIVIIILIAKAIQRICPKAYMVLTGYRK